MKQFEKGETPAILTNPDSHQTPLSPVGSPPGSHLGSTSSDSHPGSLPSSAFKLRERRNSGSTRKFFDADLYVYRWSNEKVKPISGYKPEPSDWPDCSNFDSSSDQSKLSPKSTSPKGPK